MKIKTILIWAAIFMASGVALGALGAHALQPLLPEQSLAAFKTAVQYQMVHGLALLALAGISPLIHEKAKIFRVGIFLIVTGTCLFSISIYLITLRNFLGISHWISVLGPITPLGGISLISGWILLLIQFFKFRAKIRV